VINVLNGSEMGDPDIVLADYLGPRSWPGGTSGQVLDQAPEMEMAAVPVGTTATSDFLM